MVGILSDFGRALPSARRLRRHWISPPDRKQAPAGHFDLGKNDDDGSEIKAKARADNVGFRGTGLSGAGGSAAAQMFAGFRSALGAADGAATKRSALRS